MGLRINQNIEAMQAHRSLSATSVNLAKSMERLSSGFRINSAADDAAGLGISERMRGQINGLAQAQRNAQDGISLVQTAEGALQEFHSILHRIRDLAVQYNNGVYDGQSKAAITAEVTQLNAEINRMIGVANFNGIPLLSGTVGQAMATLQIGSNNGETLVIGAVDAAGILTSGGATGVNSEITNFANATVGQVISLANIDNAINQFSTLRATFGGIQNRLEYTIRALGVYQENLSAAESRIRDVDIAAEMSNFTRLQILQQSGTAMLAQANMAPQSLLALLQ
jgi:flagellin